MVDHAHTPFTAPTATAPRTAATIHAHALSVLEECISEQDKIYAGAAWCGTKFPIERRLFTVVEDSGSDRVLFGMLGKLINELGQAAGSDYLEGPSHV
ncbi:hypothetical protein [Variovorax sp. GB1P17]|uniref:hypothetical protein n=1 Tax=Variovorax sp. GB1P17 TaxID=3443740 RepID=UPI003F4818FF